MLKRTITAICLIAFAGGLLACGLWYPIAVDVLIYCFMLLGLYEILHSFDISGYKVYKLIPFLVGVALFPMAYFFNLTGVIVTIVTGLIIVMVQFIFTKTRSLNDLMATLFSMIYPTIFMSLAFVLTREFNAVYIAVFIILVPVLTDTFAYLVGRTFKGPKLCPTISPKKTISGAIGGVLGGTLGSVAVFLIFDYFALARDFMIVPRLASDVVVDAIVYVVIGLVGAVICQFGDLFASRIKRSIGIKDFGTIFPGHGGGLDRLDSIMFFLVFLFVVFSFI